MAAGKFPDDLAPETSSTLNGSCDAIVFKILDRIPMNDFRGQLLAVRGVAHIQCLMTTLGKPTHRPGFIPYAIVPGKNSDS